MPDGGRGAFADEAAVQVQPAHPGAGGELHNRDVGVGGAQSGEVGTADTAGIGKLHDGPAFRCFVGQAGEPGGGGEFIESDVVGREEVHGTPVPVGNGAGLVEQQCGDVAGGFHCPAGCCQHVVLHQPVHSRDADGRNQRTNGGGDEADQQRNQHDGRRSGVRQ
ncbi:hypothetical protein PJL18_00338 [Paenarthrobacter nicotinovorans]|nr:hypothetical protein [Paenarthrobacter nicotinovorans]